MILPSLSTSTLVGPPASVLCQLSGRTARTSSRFRSPVDILGVTTNERTLRKLAMSWGVLPAMSQEFTSTDVMFYCATQLAKEKLGRQPGDKIVITGGIPNCNSCNTNLIKVEVIQ